MSVDQYGNWAELISKSDAVRRDGAPGGRLPPLQSNNTLELKQVREQGGLYGIGLKVDMDPPHLVQRVSNLQAPDGSSLNDHVKVGDSLLLINGQHVELGSMEALEKAILGPKDSTLKLAFKSYAKGTAGANQQNIYEIVVKRHVTIREWDETHSWLELRDEFKGNPLLAEEDIVGVMEELRRCVADRYAHARGTCTNKHNAHIDVLVHECIFILRNTFTMQVCLCACVCT